jgi:hypothetical protein
MGADADGILSWLKMSVNEAGLFLIYNSTNSFLSRFAWQNNGFGGGMGSFTRSTPARLWIQMAMVSVT